MQGTFFELPDAAVIGGEKVPIDTDFRGGIKLSIAARDESLLPDELVRCGISAFFGDNPLVYRSNEDLIENLIFFFSGGKESDDGPTPETIRRQAIIYDFESDEGLIAAAFQKEYGIDLYSCKMHWWRFLRLLEPIVSGVDFSEVVRCRAAKNVPKEMKNHVSHVKKVYPLPTKNRGKTAAPKTQDGFKAKAIEQRNRRERGILEKIRSAGD